MNNSTNLCLPTRSCYIGRQHACPCPQMEYALLKWTTITHSAHWRALTRLDLNRSASTSLPSSPTSPSSPSCPLHLLTSPSPSPHLPTPILLTSSPPHPPLLTSSFIPSSSSPLSSLLTPTLLTSSPLCPHLLTPPLPTLLTSSPLSPHLLTPTLPTLLTPTLLTPHLLTPHLLTLTFTSSLPHSLSISSQKSQRTFGHACTCYRATSSKDGLYYCLRRVHREQLPSIVPFHPRVVSFSFSLQNFV